MQESLAPDGSPVAQEVLRYDYVALTRGPLVYATGLIDGFRRSAGGRAAGVGELPAPTRRGADPGPAGRAPIRFEPYFPQRPARRRWRLTWLRSPAEPCETAAAPALHKKLWGQNIARAVSGARAAECGAARTRQGPAWTHRAWAPVPPRRSRPPRPAGRRARARPERLHRRPLRLHAAGRPGRRGDQDRAARRRQPAQVPVDAARPRAAPSSA